MEYSFFATTAAGFEHLLTEEVRNLGGTALRPGLAGVGFNGSTTVAMKLCLWSRVASRLLLPIAKVPASPVESFHEALTAIPWEEHLPGDATLAVDFIGTNTAFRNTHFGALKVKDAIVDRFQNLGKPRPSVNTEQPDLRIHVRVQAERARVSLDLSGASLHRRGWRISPTEANLKENLAAGILLLANWPKIAAGGGHFADPMCGSGSFAIEAAWMAADIAPGLHRPHFGFHTLPWFDTTEWNHLRTEAQERARTGLKQLPTLLAWDIDPRALNAARKNSDAAGLQAHIHFEQRPMEQLTPGDLPDGGLVVVNPPYGVRQGEGEEDNLRFLYQQLGEQLRHCFPGWQRAIFTARDDLIHSIGMHPDQDLPLYNGPLPCRLWIYGPKPPATTTLQPGHTPASPFANRLQKNYKQLGGWAKRSGIHCFRVYDADMPEYAAAIDLYGEWVHIQEYHPPKTVDPTKAQQRFAEMVAGITQVLDIPAERICIKVRKPQQGHTQYEKQGDDKRLIAVTEGGLKFLVNLSDYLDSGLFLDQRLLRQRIQTLARGRRFLNLFGYTGSATLYAIAGGAQSTLLVDISHTYLAWAERNLTLNGYALGPQHQFVQADCLRWIAGQNSRFDLILLAPPTFSNSKRMTEDWDVVRDYGILIARCRNLLAPGGILIFVTHAARFRMDPERLPVDMRCTEITAQTIPLDFKRKKAFHRAWELQRSH
ncbi:MAG: bifunctional 23S rRNA (guanine(2069)-N(7))-methyltransferase RlmK/23S rRNA (guanine(2445)-N(2))-methyltransferase RlmL [Magnetococcales bacterium]|nr:bifunctional 23S rRNA (guanine(2069)-N(7))-methyltransferase RlmK/23S rRNA (guanine(2445)-N(2))-methyltransferase RlmL [Magnetococcales bacterium]